MKIISYQQEQFVMDFLRQPLIVLHLHYITLAAQPDIIVTK